MRPTMETEIATFWRRSRTASLSFPNAETATAKAKPFLLREKPSRLASPPGTMTALFQRPQIVRIIAPLPTIERLPADAEVTAGVGYLLPQRL